MTPSEASVSSAEKVPRTVLSVLTLKKRADFVALNRAPRHAAPAMVVQARARTDGTDSVRVGFTCSKKVGNAVVRNRAKRRLRDAARRILPQSARPGWDYVLIGRAGGTVNRPWNDLLADLETALRKLHSRA